jgi:2-methylcitrate dehydratase PrpD
MGIANIMVKSVNDLSFINVSDDAFHWAKLGVLDTAVVTLSGVLEPCTQKFARVVAF